MHVAVIGGGLSGTLACLQLLRGSQSVHVTLIERRSRQLNRGVAYSARLSRQLLNVPAGRMGLFPDDPGSFLRWARTGPLPNAGPGDFLPRSLFGDHVHDVFHEALDHHAKRVSIVRADAVGLDHHPARGYEIRLHNRRTVVADKVLLALGNAPPAHVPGLVDAAHEHPAYIAWPWQHGALGAIAPDAPVVFIGSGLTMVDVLLSLLDQGHQGPITVLSRRGHLPRPHAAPLSWTIQQPPERDQAATVLGLMGWLRAEAARAMRAGAPWQSLMDAAKPLVQGWWQGLAVAERERFLRHARPFWEVHRHRMPGEAHERLLELKRSGRLRILASGVERVEPHGEGLGVSFRPRGTDERMRVEARHVINCTGPQTDTRRMEQPLLIDLLHQGLASWDDLHLGLRCTASGALVSATGRISEDLFALGPLCKAALWECTAVPEIRVQVAELATRLCAEAGSPRTGKGRPLWRILDRLALSSA